MQLRRFSASRPLQEVPRKPVTDNQLKFVRRLPQYFTILGYTVFCLLVVAISLELGSWALLSGYDYFRGAPIANQVTSPAIAGYTWASEVWREESLLWKHRSYVPFRVWGLAKANGKYMNNDASELGIWRRTLNPPANECEKRPRIDLWILGGSAVYGMGVPDWATLPTYLSRDLNAAGTSCTVVTNLGVEAYVANQELILLIEQLKSGRHPDIVVFYDGFNDANQGASGDPTAHYDFLTIKARVEGSVKGRLDFLRESHAAHLVGGLIAPFRGKHSPTVDEASQAKASATLDNYQANLQVAGALSRAYHFKLYFFWQPMLFYGHKVLVPFEQQLVDRNATSYQVIAAAYREAEKRAANTGAFVFLGGVFDSIQDPVYLDEVHVGPVGEQLAAQAVAQYIENHPQ